MCGAVVNESKIPCVIDGRLFDRGPKGTMQSFQVRIQSDSEKKRILDEIISVLKKVDRWAG